MLESMTGFSEHTFNTPYGTFCITLTSLNHRHFETRVYLPEEMANLEFPIRKIIEKRLKRGLIILRLKWEKSSEALDISINWKILRKYLEILQEVEKKSKRNFPVSAQFILSLPGILNTKIKNFPSRKKVILQEIELALLKLKSMRDEEGKLLYNDIYNRFMRIKSIFQKIEKENREREKESISLGENSLPDINEEITRFKSHLMAIFRELKKKHSSGLKMDFLTQEMLREANAISAKIQEPKFSHRVVEIKMEINSIREQLRNVV